MSTLKPCLARRRPPGATGSGKTTIINLLPRFYDPPRTHHHHDHDLLDVTSKACGPDRDCTAGDHPVTGTIRENCLWEAGCQPEEIEAAAKAAAAHDFIMEFPDGYETHVGERGTTLSGGQKQRWQLHGFAAQSAILILDDSTSSST